MRSPAPGCFCGKGARSERRAPRFRSGSTSGKPGGRTRPSPPRPALECAARRRRATGRQEGQTASGSERFRARVTPGPQLPACRATPGFPPGRRRATPRGGAGRGGQPAGPVPAVAAGEVNSVKSNSRLCLLSPQARSHEPAALACPCALAAPRCLTGGAGGERAEAALARQSRPDVVLAAFRTTALNCWLGAVAPAPAPAGTESCARG